MRQPFVFLGFDRSESPKSADLTSCWLNVGISNGDQSQNAKRASSQKRHMVISIFLLCNSLILMSIGAGSIRAIKGGLDKVFKIQDRLHRICRQILR